MRGILTVLKNMAVAAFMARLGIGRMIGCGVLFVLLICACIALTITGAFQF